MDAILNNTEALWGFVGVIVGSVLATFKDLLIDWLQQKRHRNYAAVRLVTMLDVFIDQCRDVAFDTGEPDFAEFDQGELAPAIIEPSSPIFSDDIDWKSLDPQLAYRILAMPAHYSAAKSAIAAADHGPPDHEEYFEERQYQFAKLGLMTLSIVNDLRRTSGLEKRLTDNEEWSAERTLPTIVHQEEQKRAAVKAESARMIAEAEGGGGSQ